MAEPEEREIEILQAYLPKQLAETKLAAIIEAKIAELSITEPQEMGQVIGAVKKQVGNAADGAAIARIVKQKLN